MPLRTAVRDTRLVAALLTIAEHEARALGDPSPSAEHLLLSAMLVDDPSARDAIGSISSTVDTAAVRAAIGAVHSASLSAIGIAPPTIDAAMPSARGAYHSEVSAQEVFQRARLLSRHSRTGISSAHVLLAAAEREYGTVARVFQHLGLDRNAVLTAATTAALT